MIAATAFAVAVDQVRGNTAVILHLEGEMGALRLPDADYAFPADAAATLVAQIIDAANTAPPTYRVAFASELKRIMRERSLGAT